MIGPTKNGPVPFTPVAVDLTCQACRGTGEIPVAKYRGCTHADPRCECGWEFGECPECCGDGRARCEGCGDPATEVDESGSLRCRACLDDRCYTEDTRGEPHDAWSGPIAENN